MLGDISEDSQEEFDRRQHHLADQPRPSLSPTAGGNASSNNNVFGLISEWITSVSFVKGIPNGERERERETL